MNSEDIQVVDRQSFITLIDVLHSEFNYEGQNSYSTDRTNYY